MRKLIAMLHPDAGTGRRWPVLSSPRLLFLFIALSVFVIEALVMLFFSALHERSWVHGLLDASLLMILLFPVLYFFGVRPLSVQIYKRVQAEKALQQSEERFRRMFEGHDAVMLLIDAESGDIVDANAAAVRFYGYPRDALSNIGIFDSDRLPRHDGAADRERSIKEHCNHFTFSHRLAGGEVKTVEVHSTPMEINQRRLHFSIIHDITERKNAEIQLLATAQERERLIAELRGLVNAVSLSQKQWQDTFDSITEMISIHDKDFTVIKANRAFAAYLGREPQDVVNRKCYELIHHGASSPVPGCPHQKTLEEKRPMTEEMSDGQTKKTFRISTYPYFSPGGAILGSIHIMKDITAEKEKEMQLIMAERLALLGQMASGIAHEISNPLEAILIGAEALLMRTEQQRYEPEVFRKYLGIIDEEAIRCRDITKNMLSYARKTTSGKTDIDLGGLLDRTLALIGFQGRLKNVAVVKEYGTQAVTVRGNEGELRQVFLAILLNALDAMNDGGSVTISIGAGDNEAFASVRDTGRGISPDIRQKIFAPFFSTKTDRRGTGLGLSIAQKIVANHGGAIEAASDMKHGALFTVRLPR